MKIAPLLAIAATATAGGCLAAMPAAGAPVSAPPGGTPWSAPARLSACAAAAAPRVVFPSDGPREATGPGAIVWSASSSCPGGAGARVAALGAGELPGASTIPRTAAGVAIAPRGPLLASGAPHAQIVVAGASPRAGADADGVVIQGVAGGPFSPLLVPAGAAAPTALATAYLGDVALAATPAGPGASGALNLHVERFYSRRFGRNTTVRAPGGGVVRGLALALDYRSEALAVWTQRGELYARLMPSAGRARAIQRLAPVSGATTIAAVLSDDGHAILAWSERHGADTGVYLDRSAAGVRFATPPQLLERFGDPDGEPAPSCSPTLVRLSSEGVALAWAGSLAGRWVVHVAPVEEGGVLGIDTIGADGLDARLAALAPGPDDDALLLWTEARPRAGATRGATPQSIFAARGTESLPGAITFDEREQVAPAGPVTGASVAFDPDDDRAVAAWRGERSAIEYSVRMLVDG